MDVWIQVVHSHHRWSQGLGGEQEEEDGPHELHGAGPSLQLIRSEVVVPGGEQHAARTHLAQLTGRTPAAVGHHRQGTDRQPTRCGEPRGGPL